MTWETYILAPVNVLCGLRQAISPLSYIFFNQNNIMNIPVTPKWADGGEHAFQRENYYIDNTQWLYTMYFSTLIDT